jgi:hypothetical protein
MLTWMLCGVGVAALIGWKVLHDAQVDDKRRNQPKKRGAGPARRPPPKKR